MKLFAAAMFLIAATSAAPSYSDIIAARRALPAIEHEDVRDEFGQYALRYVTAEGTVVTERGRLVPTADGREFVLVIEGQTSYVGDDGKQYVTKYRAGLDGNHVEGAHLPLDSLADK